MWTVTKIEIMFLHRSLFLYFTHTKYTFYACTHRVAQKECNTYDQWFQENEGQNKQVVCIIGYKILFPARWHQDHQFWWRCFDSMAVFLRQCNFQNLPLGSDPKIVNLKAKFSIWNSCGLLYIIRKQGICSLRKYIWPIMIPSNFPQNDH